MLCTPAMASSSYKPNLRRVLTNAARIITARPRHFLTLSFLFLLPDAIADSFLTQQPDSIHARVHRSVMFLPQTENPQFRVPIIYNLLSLFLSLSATASITYSTIHGFYGNPVDLISSLNSILISFFPLLATNLVKVIYVIAIGVLAFLASNGLIRLIGFYVGYGSQFLVAFVNLMLGVLLLGIVIYLVIEWTLSSAVVVVESKWGFEPLGRSSELVKGVKGTVVLVMLVFAVPAIAVSLVYIYFSMGFKAGGISWISGLLMAVYALVMTVLPLYGTAAMAILFAYCREWNGFADEELGNAKLSGVQGHL